LGVEFSFDQVIDTLNSLGFSCEANKKGTEIQVTVPYWRSDIKLPVDLVEEVARIIGYDHIPMTLLSESIPPVKIEPVVELKHRIRGTLVGYGFQNVVTFSLVSSDLLTKLLPQPHPLEPKPVRLVNPMTVDQEYLRPTLRANLISALVSNQRFEEGGIKLFELSRIYVPREKQLPDERETVSGILCGLQADKTCHDSPDVVDFYDAKGIVEALLQQLGITPEFIRSEDEGLHPYKQAAINIGSNRIGIVGELHPQVALNFEIAEPVFIFEVDLNSLLPYINREKLFQPLAKFPAVVRDIALVVDIEVPNQKILNTIYGFSMIKQAEVFDIYTGEQVSPGKKSLAYHLTFQSPDRTLKEQEINGVMKGLLIKLSKEAGAELRS
jgi:phenylalanyl-tRNA synthetase beta chain